MREVCLKNKSIYLSFGLRHKMLMFISMALITISNVPRWSSIKGGLKFKCSQVYTTTMSNSRLKSSHTSHKTISCLKQFILSNIFYEPFPISGAHLCCHFFPTSRHLRPGNCGINQEGGQGLTDSWDRFKV